MKDIKTILGHALFYGEVALKSFAMFISYMLLLIFYPITTMLRRFNARTLSTTKWPAAMRVEPKRAKGR